MTALKKIFIILFSISLIVNFTSCTKNENNEGNIYDEDISLAKVYLNKKLRIGIEVPFAPIASLDKGIPVGFDIDVLTEVCERLEIRSEFINIDWREKDILLQEERIDMIASGFGVTPSRMKQYLISSPILQNAQVIVVRNDSPITTLEQLEGKKIGVQAGSSGEAIMLKKVEEGHKFNLQTNLEVTSEINDLLQHGLDAIVIDLLVINYEIKKNKLNLRILETSMEAEKYAYAYRINDLALRNEIQRVLYEMAEDGVLEAITRKWFDANISLIR